MRHQGRRHPRQATYRAQAWYPFLGQEGPMSAVSGTLPDTIANSNHMRPYRVTFREFLPIAENSKKCPKNLPTSCACGQVVPRSYDHPTLPATRSWWSRSLVCYRTLYLLFIAVHIVHFLSYARSGRSIMRRYVMCGI